MLGESSESRGDPGSIRSQGVVLVVKMSELSKPEEDLQEPGEAQGPVEVQLLAAEVGEAPSDLASYPPASCSTPVEPLPREILNEMMANLMKFLLLNLHQEGSSQLPKAPVGVGGILMGPSPEAPYPCCPQCPLSPEPGLGFCPACPPTLPHALAVD
ncbi:hypothetical protein ABFV05_020201 [Capra hircus]